MNAAKEEYMQVLYIKLVFSVLRKCQSSLDGKPVRLPESHLAKSVVAQKQSQLKIDLFHPIVTFLDLSLLFYNSFFLRAVSKNAVCGT